MNRAIRLHRRAIVIAIVVTDAGNRILSTRTFADDVDGYRAAETEGVHGECNAADAATACNAISCSATTCTSPVDWIVAPSLSVALESTSMTFSASETEPTKLPSLLPDAE